MHDMEELEQSLSLHACKKRHVLSKGTVLIDSASTVNKYANGRLLHGLHKVKRGIFVKCNAGMVYVDQKGYFGSFPEPVWFNPKGIANILSKYLLAQHYHVWYDNNVLPCTHRR